MFDKYKLFRGFAYTLEILVLYVLQETPSLFMAVSGIRPVLIISAAVTIAILENQNIGFGFGAFCGILMDIGSGGLIGFNALFLSVLCYFVGLAAVDYIKTNIITAFICSIISVFLLLSIHFIFFYVFKSYSSAGYAYFKHYLPMMFYAVLPTPILYLLNKALALFGRERA